MKVASMLLLWILLVFFVTYTLATAGLRAWVAYRCRKHGHAWQETEEGFRCFRCGHGMGVGDRM